MYTANFPTVIVTIKSKDNLVQIELKHEDVSYIGLIKSTADDSLKIQPITPMEKKEKIELFDTKDIWTIQFDNDYTNSLSLLIDKG